MPIVEDDRSIKEARALLKEWGKFWQRYFEQPSGGSLMASFIQNQKSATKYHKRRYVNPKTDPTRKKLKGVDRPYTADCSPTFSASVAHKQDVFIPWHLENINDLIENMQPECANALKLKYIEDEEHLAKGIWLDRAERIVLYSL